MKNQGTCCMVSQLWQSHITTTLPTGSLCSNCYEVGNPIPSFHQFVRELDGSVGMVDAQEHRQTCTTLLNSSQADGLTEKYPFLLVIYTSRGHDGDIALDSGKEMFHAIPKQKSARPKLLPRRLLPEDSNAPYWRKMISSPFHQPPLQLPSQDPLYMLRV